MAARRTAWVCPRCSGRVLAGSRPAYDDVSRWCLSCAAETGYLVLRRAPALERRSENAAALRKERTRRRAEVARAREDARYGVRTVDALGRGAVVDLRVLLREAEGLGAIREARRPGARTTLRVIRRREHRQYDGWPGGGVGGRADGYDHLASGDVSISLWGEPVGREELEETVVHEVAHLASPREARHGVDFQRVLRRALRERWSFLDLGPVDERGSYAMDRSVVEQLLRATREGRTWD